jgi:hypothetical protein
MAPPSLANDPGERYAELERAYTEDRWPDVVELGGQLIADLGNTPDPVTMDLANRAQLLVGHAHLYGLRDPAAALPLYQAVLAGPADPDLRRIAEEALPHCQPPVEPKAPSADESAAGAAALESGSGNSAAEAFATSAPIEAATSPAVAQERGPWATLEATAEPLGDQPLDTEAAWTPQAGTAERVITEAATPWLQPQPLQLEQPIQNEVGGGLAAPSTTSPSLVPSLEVELEVDVVEEPELVEVAQADPSLAEELELELTRIRERRAARRSDPAAIEGLATPAPAAWAAPLEPDDLDDLMDDPELLAGLLRVVVTP